jgi:parallel beta-helix repeat protein
MTDNTLLKNPKAGLFLGRIILGFIIVFVSALVEVRSIFASTQANTYIVNTHESAPDANPGDGICQTASWLDVCTLQAAIEESNADNAVSIINFSTSFINDKSIHGCALPDLTEGYTIIDASDQWLSYSDIPGVEIIEAGSCAFLKIKSDGNTIRGLNFGGSNDFGIHISGGKYNNIGGSEEHYRNVFSTETGVKISGGSYNTVEGNFFGTKDGKSIMEGIITGIDLDNTDSNIVEGNIIAGADEYGIRFWNGSQDNLIKNNYIGDTNNNSADLGNKIGIYIHHSDHNQIGPGNLINNNERDGIHLSVSHYTVIENNSIGIDYFESNKDNGVYSYYSDNVLLSHNEITSNKGNGVYMEGGSNSQITGGYIRNNLYNGILLEDTSNVKVKSIEITGNADNGLHLRGASQVGALILNNTIGLKQGTKDAGNLKNGVLIEGGAHSNTIGGYGTNEGNWIGWNGLMGVLINGSTTRSNTVLGNVIGAPVTWDKKAPNGQHGVGIYNGAHDNSIGTLFVGNFIVGNKWSGIGIDKSDDNTVMFNFIGTDGTDANWKNDGYGVHIVDSKGTQVQANEIAYNNNGVIVSGGSADGNLISQNSIHDHVSTGIDLLNGANNSVDLPLITSAICSGPVTGKACPGCQVEIFSDNDGEGRVYEGSVVADSSGNFSWEGKPNGPEVTATNTDLADNTSIFSFGWELIPACNLPPSAVFTHSPKAGSACTLFKFDASGSSDPDDPKSTLKVRWDFDNNGVYETDWNKSKTITQMLGSSLLDAPTVQTVRMQVTDNKGLTDTTTKQIEIEVGCVTTRLPLIFK